eukprot:jgi/Chrzof1/11487/UNPLg00419.t1
MVHSLTHNQFCAPPVCRSLYPINRGLCGNWVQQYSEMHAAILNGSAPQRYAVMISHGNGLGDRLISTVSVLLYAVLTERAFMYDWHGNHELTQAFQSSFINWTYQPGKLGNSSHWLFMDWYGTHDKEAKVW